MEIKMENENNELIKQMGAQLQPCFRVVSNQNTSVAHFKRFFALCNQSSQVCKWHKYFICGFKKVI